MKTFTPDEVNKIIKNNGIGGFFFRSGRLLDQRFCGITFGELNDEVQFVLQGLKNENLDPALAYSADDADCDNFALWIWSDVLKRWAKRKLNRGALLFGTTIVPGHDINIGICENEKVCVWDYGVYSPDFDLSIIYANEIEFR